MTVDAGGHHTDSDEKVAPWYVGLHGTIEGRLYSSSYEQGAIGKQASDTFSLAQAELSHFLQSKTH